MFYKLIVFFFSLSMVSCNCAKDSVANENEISEKKEGTSQEFKLPIQEVYYQKWIAGVQGGGSGINFYVVLKAPLKKEIVLEKVQFESYEGLFIKQSDSVYIANIKTNLNDLVLDEDPKNEYGNKPPVAKLKSKEANLYYQVNRKEVIHNFKNVKEKEMLAYPSMKPQNNEE